jgi:hypothetical protein
MEELHRFLEKSECSACHEGEPTYQLQESFWYSTFPIEAENTRLSSKDII